MSEINVVVKVNVTRKNDFNRYLNQINTAARKVGVRPFNSKFLYRIQEEKISHTSGKKQLNVNCYSVMEVVGENPIIGGYEFIARLDFEAGKKKANVACVPGQEIPIQFFDAKPTCEHCKSNRARNTVYILKSESRHIQVGSTCLRDFLGHGDIQGNLKLIGLFGSCHDFIEPSKQMNSYETPVDKMEMLTDIVKLVDEFGYVSRKMCETNERLEATSDKYWFGFWQFFQPIKDLNENQQRIMKAMTNETTEAQKAKVQLILNALNELNNSTTSYEHNLANLRDADYWMLKDAAMVASMIPFAERKIKENTREAEGPVSEFLASIGQRINVSILVNQVHEFETAWGRSFLHACNDSNGNSIIFYSPRRIAADGESLKIVGTVKDHKKYKGVKQTTLNRVRVK